MTSGLESGQGFPPPIHSLMWSGKARDAHQGPERLGSQLDGGVEARTLVSWIDRALFKLELCDFGLR